MRKQTKQDRHFYALDVSWSGNRCYRFDSKLSRDLFVALMPEYHRSVTREQASRDYPLSWFDFSHSWHGSVREDDYGEYVCTRNFYHLARQGLGHGFCKFSPAS